MVLTVEPQNELKFRGPFTVPITSYMKITNPTETKVAYKIKTTAPKKYCVRPNGGVLDPEQSVEIAVSLQPFEYDQSEKNRHKFMVQSLIVPDEDYNLDNLWRDTPTETLWIYKLKCVFELPDPTSPAAPASSAVVNASVVQPETKSIVPNVENSRKPISIDQTNVAREITRLREELSRMRQENFQLKEETVKLRIQNTTQPTSAASTKENLQVIGNDYQMKPVLYLIFGVVVGLFAMIVGQYIF